MSKDLEFDFESENTEDDGRLIYTVTQISGEIKAILEDSYPGVWLRGEISNFKLYSSGHMYFSLKDENAQINAVMFQNANTGLIFAPEDGMGVLVYGRVSSYPKRGDYQIIVNHMEQYGAGDLFASYEKLKKKLEEEGLFDESSKKEIPLLVNKIGIVTSRDGAALRDILKVLDGLDVNVEALIYPVRVQGTEAEKEIPEAISYLNKQHKELDVLLVGRGGGSIEDLWAFNTEPVARAIYQSAIPVVSCVGHEVDFTIADFVADMRAPTPSAAAEMVVRRKRDAKSRLEDIRKNLVSAAESVLNGKSRKLDTLAAARAFLKPHLIYEDKITYVDGLDARMSLAVKRLTETKEEKLKNICHKLDLVSPISVMKRGFSVCFNDAGKIVKDAQNVSVGAKIDIKLAKGSLKASVEVKHND